MYEGRLSPVRNRGDIDEIAVLMAGGDREE
jgi:hypothetical protein